MTFYLIKDKAFHIPYNPSQQLTPQEQLFCKSIELPVAIEYDETTPPGSEDCETIKALFESGENEGRRSTLEVNLGLRIIANDDLRISDHVVVCDIEEGDAIEKLKQFFNDRGLLGTTKVEVKGFTASYHLDPNENFVVESVITIDMDDLLTGISRVEGLFVPHTAILPYFSEYSSRRFWNPYTKFDFNGYISISCTLYSAVDPQSKILFGQQANENINRRILEEGLYSDATIITKDGFSLKCHKSFLSAHSRVFNDTFKESGINTIEMRDMTAAEVEAFLAYLYYGGQKAAEEAVSVAITLLEAGHKYDITKLEESMKIILLSTSENYYKLEEAMKLFLFARNLANGEELKMKAIKFLKLNFDTLKVSPSYKQLFTENLETAMELCDCLVSYDL